jgi:hypothetical protein
MMLKIAKNYCAYLSRKLNIVAYLTAENLALRQQLLVLKRHHKSPKLRERDRLFWVVMSHIWTGWREALLIVRPDTVVRWHRRAFKLYWQRKSQAGKRGRPPVDPDVRAMIIKMADSNPTWGARMVKKLSRGLTLLVCGA